MKKKLLLLASLILCISYSCNLQPQNNSSLQKSKDSTSITATNTKQVTPSQLDTSYHTDKWDYKMSQDSLGNKFYFATIFSPETLDFKPMYDTGIIAVFGLVHRFKENLVVLRVSEGAFIHNNGATDSLRIRFDDNTAEEFAYYRSNTAREGDILIEPAKKLIDELKRSKKIVIEATFYKNGTRQMEFNTANLMWNH
jgi:hypothetical protein